MENRKDIILEEGRAFFIGFIIAGGIAFLFWLAIGVNAQTLSMTSIGTFASPTLDKNGKIVLIDTPALDTKNNPAIDTAMQLQNCQISVSKYAQLYDSCKNKR